MDLSGRVIGVDFDGTCVDHRFPLVASSVPGASYALKALVARGARIMLWTMRSDTKRYPTALSDARAWFSDRGIPLWGVNENPEQREDAWSTSHKQHANYYIDDAAVGCPLQTLPGFARPCVDWAKVLDLLGVAYDPIELANN